MPGTTHRGWSGPPPLLLVATVVLYTVAVLSSDAEPSEQPAQDRAHLAASEPSTEPTTEPTETAEPATEPTADATTEPTEATTEPTTEATEPPSRRIGLVSFNAYRDLTLEQTIADARTLGRKKWADIIGWQEAYRMGQVRPELRKLGWRTAWADDGSAELAISWRAGKFRFVGSDRRMVAPGVDPATDDFPVSNRFILRVVLQERATGRKVSVITTHLPQAIEQESHPGRWRTTTNADRARRQLTALARVFDNSPGRWVLGTADMNFDVSNERRVKPRGGPTRTLKGHATSSYQALGSKGLARTHPVSGRNIDYVYAGTPAVRKKQVAFLRHQAIGGLHSDHRPLLVRLKLS